mmetsp:Transcript_33283/g.97015  ORF Transcript_33283/g.97015 Transcript_33283/m.97015 type:complete len:229 (+) Transcript_33283:2-688(+)
MPMVAAGAAHLRVLSPSQRRAMAGPAAAILLRERLAELQATVDDVGTGLAAQRRGGAPTSREDFDRSRDAVESTLRLSRSLRARLLLEAHRGGSAAEAAEVFAALPELPTKHAIDLARNFADEGFKDIPERVVGHRWQGENPESECAVCLARFRPGELQKVTRCGHRFHLRCLRSWLVGHLKGHCPMCRAPAGGASALADAEGDSSRSTGTSPVSPTQPPRSFAQLRS